MSAPGVGGYGHPGDSGMAEPARPPRRPAQNLHSSLLGGAEAPGRPAAPAAPAPGIPAAYRPIPPPTYASPVHGAAGSQPADPRRNGHAAPDGPGASYAGHRDPGPGGAGYVGGYGDPDRAGFGGGSGYDGIPGPAGSYGGNGGYSVDGDRDPGLLTHRAAYAPDGDPLDTGYGFPAPPGRGRFAAGGDQFYPDDGDIPPDEREPGRHRRPGRPGWLKVMAWVFAVVGLFGAAIGGWGFFEYHRLSNNITRIDALAPNDPAIKQAAKQRNAENYLLIGSDTREGANSGFGNVTGARSDTTILAHLSPGRDKALLVSFPRDSWVDLPPCQRTKGGTSPGGEGMFNSAFEVGGPKCTVLAVQKLTGISVNHYVQVDFTGFQTMVEALGGVTICSTEEVDDPKSGLRLHKGSQVLRGAQALAYVRARKTLGDGSDIGRIQRQQRFLGAMIRKATGSKLLFNPLALTRFLDAATKSLTLDRATSLKDLKALGDQLRDLDPKKVSFITAPIANQDYTPPGTNLKGRVLLDDVAGRRLYDSIINDKPAPPKTTAPGTKPKTAAKVTLTVAPGDVSVKVLNGVGLTGLAARTAADLTSVGFAVTNTGNGPTGTKVTQVRYAPDRADAARTLVAGVPGAVLQEDGSLGHTLQLVVGANYRGAVAVQVGQQVATPANSTAATTTSGGTPRSTAPVPAITASDTSCST